MIPKVLFRGEGSDFHLGDFARSPTRKIFSADDDRDSMQIKMGGLRSEMPRDPLEKKVRARSQSAPLFLVVDTG